VCGYTDGGNALYVNSAFAATAPTRPSVEIPIAGPRAKFLLAASIEPGSLKSITHPVSMDIEALRALTDSQTVVDIQIVVAHQLIAGLSSKHELISDHESHEEVLDAIKLVDNLQYSASDTFETLNQSKRGLLFGVNYPVRSVILIVAEQAL